KATAFDSFSDALSSLAVLICLVISRISGVDLDGYVGVCVSIVIAVAGVKVLNDTKNSILGESPKAEQIEKIRAIVAEYPDVLGIHDLVVHQYGPSFAMVSLHAEVDGNRNFFEMHDTIDLVEQRLNREMHVIATIHMDPIVVDDEQTLLLREQVVQVVRSIDPSLNIHDFRFVDGVSHINLIFDLEASFDIPMTDDALCDRVRSKVSELDQKYKCVISVDRS
ncbi:MAG: cation-efflux pump, partial [Clostridia bacterium]|nr:cation-efflux pump [Clostridia bacterium]